MRISKCFCFLILAGFLCFAGTNASHAQVSLNVQIGPAPVCPYGYYAYSPYNCAPFGYYGPQWFTSGVFIGAGPWFRGPVGFHGWINRAYDPYYGYCGPYPYRGERPDWGRHRGWDKHFRGNDEYDGRGHAYGHYKDHGNGHANGHYKQHGNPHGDHGNGHGNGHGHDD